MPGFGVRMIPQGIKKRPPLSFNNSVSGLMITVPVSGRWTLPLI
jgi:hypothetical protein